MGGVGPVGEAVPPAFEDFGHELVFCSGDLELVFALFGVEGELLGFGFGGWGLGF